MDKEDVKICVVLIGGIIMILLIISKIMNNEVEKAYGRLDRLSKARFDNRGKKFLIERIRKWLFGIQ